MACSSIVFDRVFFLNWAIESGAQSAADMLLLIGPDGFCGSYEMYLDLERTLTEAITNGN